MNTREILKAVGSAATLLNIPETEAQKAHDIERGEVKVTKKVTFKNFYQNTTFWYAVGTAIVAGTIGDYAGAASALFGLFGAS